MHVVMSDPERRFPIPDQGSRLFVTPARLDSADVRVVGDAKKRTPPSLQPKNLHNVLSRHGEITEDLDYVAGNLDSTALVPVIRAYKREGVSVADLQSAVADFARGRGLDEEKAGVFAASFSQDIYEAGRTHNITLTQTHRIPESVSLNRELSGRRATRPPRPGKA